MRVLLLCLLLFLAGCGGGDLDLDPTPAAICEKDTAACAAQQYAPTKQHYGAPQ